MILARAWASILTLAAAIPLAGADTATAPGVTMRAGSPAGAADPAAVIVEISGRGTIHSVAGVPPRLALPGSHLASRDSLDLSANATATLLLRSGSVQRVARSIRLPADTVQPRAGLLSLAFQTFAQIASTDVRGQPNRQGMIRPLPGTVVLRSPRNEILLATGRPTFVWMPVDGAPRYRLLIQRPAGEPLRFSGIADTTWVLPLDTPDLEAGLHTWTVAAEPGGRPGEGQRFRVATPEERVAVASALRELGGSNAGGEPEGFPLAAAMTYHAAGFHYDALGALDHHLRGDGPASRELHLLHAAVLEATGDIDEAAAARERANLASDP